MNPRPKRPRPDGNQGEVVAYLRASGLAVVVTAALPGVTTPDNPLDFFVVRPPAEGEERAPVIVAWSGPGVLRAMRQAFPGQRIAQVELKVPGGTLEPHQEQYLRRMGWDGRIWR